MKYGLKSSLSSNPAQFPDIYIFLLPSSLNKGWHLGGKGCCAASMAGFASKPAPLASPRQGLLILRLTRALPNSHCYEFSPSHGCVKERKNNPSLETIFPCKGVAKNPLAHSGVIYHGYKYTRQLL